jgi:hypothetical protein
MKYIHITWHYLPEIWFSTTHTFCSLRFFIYKFWNYVLGYWTCFLRSESKNLCHSVQIFHLTLNFIILIPILVQLWYISSHPLIKYFSRFFCLSFAFHSSLTLHNHHTPFSDSSAVETKHLLCYCSAESFTCLFTSYAYFTKRVHFPDAILFFDLRVTWRGAWKDVALTYLLFKPKTLLLFFPQKHWNYWNFLYRGTFSFEYILEFHLCPWKQRIHKNVPLILFFDFW